MHLLIPFASSTAEGCQEVIRTLKLPNLQRLLALFPVLYRDQSDVNSFSPPHERAYARSLTGMDKPPRSDDSRFPWATWHVLKGNPPGDRSGAWAFVTPCHWEVHTTHVHMRDPAQLNLSERIRVR